MKLFILSALTFLSLNAFAVTDFTCFEVAPNGQRVDSSFELKTLNVRQIKVSTDWDVDGIYELAHSRNGLWLTFLSHEFFSVKIIMESKMFYGKAGFVKQILQDGHEELVKVFKCIPGQK